MEPVWEYQYEIDDGPRRGLMSTGFYLTDEEAARWPRIREATTRRLDETRRDRNLQPPPGFGFGHIMPKPKNQ
ncbi:hypothetical protein [Paraburkholderia saeva]|uniref:hypothetical protein n=1 Tax=Paraburkholderia saeva TaxID=2777537 RepID=UPI001D7EE31D|nr:hypothetical protein [Paraburkholderia saeva]CAG4888065.1 hypothetical protein R52603_00569 [Paraburkholderia saeva]